MPLRVFESISTADYRIGLAAAAVTIIFLFFKTHLVARFTSKNDIPLPPGPPARWFWDDPMPSVNVARTLAEWVAEYGPVITLRQGSQVTILVGRVDAVAEIMEKEGSALADRPRSIPAGEILSKNLRFVLLRSGERLRRYRKAAHTHLQPRAVRGYQDMQLENAKNLIMDILNDGKNHQAHVRRFAASVILRMLYGKSTPTSNDDPEVIRIQQVVENVKRALRPGAYLVDHVPLLKYIPGYGRELEEYHNFEVQLFREQMERVRLEMETSRSGNSFMRTLLEHASEHQLSRDEMAYIAGNLFSGGSETSSIAITTMILAAACFPEAQKRVQDELDAVIGKCRMPSWEDSESLPQVHAYVLEALRWRPVFPMGFAHRATQDVVWRGQCIPAGATVIGCHWAISQDPVAFPKPEKFDPQRWFSDDGRLRKDLCSYPYGFGRRACPGHHFANNSMYISLALLLWSFQIVERPNAPIDKDGFTDGFVMQAVPFDVEFIPRIEDDRLKEMMSQPVA